MYIVAFGASGQVGRLFVAQALQAGHKVLAISRQPVAFSVAEARASQLQVRHGDVLDARFVDEALPHADAVFSGLGLKRAREFPWSALISPKDLVSRATSHILAAMEQHKIRRLAVISTAGASETHAKMNLLMRFLVATSQIGASYRDLARMEALLLQSNSDFMAVRPTRLTNQPAKKAVRIISSGEFPTWASIPRASVAAYMLQQLEQPRFDAQFPTITT